MHETLGMRWQIARKSPLTIPPEEWLADASRRAWQRRSAYYGPKFHRIKNGLSRFLVLRCSTDELVKLLDSVRDIHHDGFLLGYGDGKRHMDRQWAAAQERAVQRIRDGIDKPVGWE